MIRKIESKEFANFYQRMFEEFPASEMKPFEDFNNLLLEGKYQCLGYFVSEQMIGYALGMLTSQKFFWLDYLHIFKENQSGGHGSKFLNELLSEIATNGIILETEVIDNDDYQDNKNKRMRFYDRFNIHQIDCKYLFPCSDGTYIDTLNLEYIPPKGKTYISALDFKTAIRESVGCIHQALSHSQSVMNQYIETVKDLHINYFTLEDVDLNNEEEIEAIGKLIYYTDPYIYPDFFNNDISLAIKCAKELIYRDTVYNHKFIKLGKINGKTAGFMVILDNFPENNYQEMKLAMLESLGYLTPKFEQCMVGYFNTLNYDWEGLQIMSLAVLPEYRQKRVATKMLNSLSSKNTYSLACVKDNTSARNLYHKCGFNYKYEYPGYTDVMCVELVRKGK